MIIKRQKLFSKKKKIGSYFRSQIEGCGSDYNILNGERYEDGSWEISEAFRKMRKMLHKAKTNSRKGGTVKVRGKDILITNWQGNDKNTGRQTYQTFVSDKSPKEAYRDWLRNVKERQSLGDLKPGGEPTLSNKEIKRLLRKEIKKRNIKTASVGLGIGALATAGTAVGVKAYKKKKKHN